MKKKKIIIFALTAAASVAILSGATTSCVTLAQNQEINNSRNEIVSYIYDNKIFSNMDEVATYFINKNPNSVEDKMYIGDLNEAILDPSSLLLDINDLKPYNKEKMHPVYLNALGNPTHNYEEAKKSYINPGLIEYKFYDFNNNLFDTEEEAKDSIKKSKNPTPVFYYKDIAQNANHKFNFNPLSKKDFNEFKKTAIKSALNDDMSEFSIKIYDKGNNSQHGTIIGNDFIHNIINDAITKYISTKEQLLKESKFNVTLSLNKNSMLLWRHNYSFANFHTTRPNTFLSNGQIHFNNVSINELLKFNMFLNRNEFANNSTIWWKRQDGVLPVAEEATVNILNTSFEIKHSGEDKGGTLPLWSPDICILEKGDEDDGSNYLSFYLDVNIPNFKEKFEKKLDEFIPQEDSFVNRITKLIFETIFNKFLLIDINDIGRHSWDGSGNKAEMSDITQLNNVLKDNWFLTRELLKKHLIIDNSLSDLGGYLSKNKIRYSDTIISDKIDDLNEKIFKKFLSAENHNFIIEYNNSPIFNFSLNLNSNQINDYKILEWNGKQNKYISNILSTFGDALKSTINSNQKDQQAFFDSFINVSQNFSKNSTSTNLVDYKNVNRKIFKLNNNGELEINTEFYKELNPDVIPEVELGDYTVPELKNNVDFKYKISSMVPVYNNIIAMIKKLHPTNWQNIVKEQLVKPEDIVILHNDQNKMLEFSFSKFLSNGTQIMPNLVGNESVKLVNSEQELNELIEQTLIIKPAKVIVIYDLLGNIINPGVELTPEEAIATTSDAIFDSKQTIIDNILRTKLIPKDLSRTYYLDDKNQYHLLKNEINQIYILTLENKKFYFPSHISMMNELRKYLLTKVEKVVYEK